MSTTMMMMKRRKREGIRRTTRMLEKITETGNDKGRGILCCLLTEKNEFKSKCIMNKIHL